MEENNINLDFTMTAIKPASKLCKPILKSNFNPPFRIFCIERDATNKKTELYTVRCWQNCPWYPGRQKQNVPKHDPAFLQLTAQRGDDDDNDDDVDSDEVRPLSGESCWNPGLTIKYRVAQNKAGYFIFIMIPRVHHTNAQKANVTLLI